MNRQGLLLLCGLYLAVDQILRATDFITMESVLVAQLGIMILAVGLTWRDFATRLRFKARDLILFALLSFPLAHRLDRGSCGRKCRGRPHLPLISAVAP